VAGNETNFFVRDATNGSKIPFKVRPGADKDSLVVEGNGDVTMSGGYLGIGDTSPDADLNVIQTNSTSGFHLERAGNPVTMLFEDTTGAQKWEFKINSAGDFAINDPDASGGEFFLDSDGNLQIQGSFISNGTTLNVPDYVFEPHYQLMPLDQLASFVTENKHLPKVPSRAEVRKTKQVNMTQLQMTLLEKVEELTLYTIDQQAQLEELQKQNETLRNRLESMEQGGGSVE
jgi:hypothetical protein